MRHHPYILCAIMFLACGSSPPADENPLPQAVSRATVTEVFREISAAAGVDFQHVNGMTGAFYFAEIIGSGGALFDYDKDGDLDLYLVQGHLLGQDTTMDEAVIPYTGPLPLRDRLFRNDLDAPGGKLVFTDVTEASGINATGYGMGAAVGDYNGDGWPDLYVSQHGSNHLFANQGDGTFVDVIQAAGADDPRFTVSLSFVDLDGDGSDDLFLGNYLDYDVRRDQSCFGRTQDYCHPSMYAAWPDRFLKNKGDGSFEDITPISGINAAYGRALGVAVVDFDRNGLVDIYVANDATANQFWVNRDNRIWQETALLAGCAVNEMGKAEASMGVDAADFDGDGDEDLFMTHNRNETNTLYVNDGSGLFTDQTVAAGLGAPSLSFAGFGTRFIDYDNDGLLDLFVANGTVSSLADTLGSDDPFPYHQTNQLFRNTGNGIFEDTSASSGSAMALSEVSRAAMFGDLDNDGDWDIVVTNNNGPTRILENLIGNRNPWLGLHLVNEKDLAVHGVLVEIERTDGSRLLRRTRRDGSYACANDPRALVGLGRGADVKELRIAWPDGLVETYEPPELGAWHTLKRGEGIAVSEQ